MSRVLHSNGRQSSGRQRSSQRVLKVGNTHSLLHPVVEFRAFERNSILNVIILALETLILGISIYSYGRGCIGCRLLAQGMLTKLEDVLRKYK